MTEQEFLKNYDITQYPQPSVAADIVLFTLDQKHTEKTIGLGPLQVLLIQRATHPCKDLWALPGGFCQPNETFPETAHRELKTETGVEYAYLSETKTFTDKKRDPRGWIVSDAFTGAIWKPDCTLRTDENAWKAQWFDVKLDVKSSVQNKTTTYNEYTLRLGPYESIIKCVRTIDHNRIHNEWSIIHQHSAIAFDHALIITELLVNLQETVRNDPKMLFEFLPDKFTIGELESVYKAIFGIIEHVPNFRRMIQKYVIETPIMTDKKQSFRPAKLYIRNYQMF